MEPLSLSIRELIDTVVRGQIRIPAFQRGFVWGSERVAYLMDTIYKGYPFGALLFWRTREKLRTERFLGPFDLPEPKEDYPVDYVLDGQQRATAMFGAFQTELPIARPEMWRDVYFDYRADQTAQDSQFIALLPGEVDATRHFPMRVLFDTTEYRKATSEFSDELAIKIDEMQARFKEAKIPVQIFRTEDKATVAIIFERVNRQGVPLDTLQLLSAWTWSEEFQLQEQFLELAGELAPFGFEDLGTETNLLLRCCSAILSADAAPSALMTLNGVVVRERFQEVINGVMGAVDYLRANFGVEKLENLPFSTVLVPLSVFFASQGNVEVNYSDEQRRRINRWFWRVAFTKRYSSGVLRNLKTDIDEMRKLREGTASSLGEFAAAVVPEFFIDNTFGMGNVNTKTFILLLAQQLPLSFASGMPVNLEGKLRASNRTEFHHLMPRAYLQRTDQKKPDPSALVNFAFLSKADNRMLGGQAPSEYRRRMPAEVEEILRRALTPTSLFDDNYDTFVIERALILADVANVLCENAA